MNMEDEEEYMSKSKEVVTTIIIMIGFAFLVLGSVLVNHENIDKIVKHKKLLYLGILLFFIIKFCIFVRK